VKSCFENGNFKSEYNKVLSFSEFSGRELKLIINAASSAGRSCPVLFVEKAEIWKPINVVPRRCQLSKSVADIHSV
jgi:hypothetical protein